MTNLPTPSVPNHVGIIMDGNGRWAKEKGKPRTAGHREGLDTAKKIVKAASDLGIRYVTLYTFSTENWKRAEEEVSFLMHLIGQHLRAEARFYKENSIRVGHVGDLDGLPEMVRREIQDVIRDTAGFTGLTVNLAINYGGRDEIIRAFRRWYSRASREGILNPESLTEAELAACLDSPDTPDPDLIIRTGGEQRLSNFLLWQSAYTEFYYSDKLWPDWTAEDLEGAVSSFMKRQRRFGGTN